MSILHSDKSFRWQICLLMVIFGVVLLVVIIVLAAWDMQPFLLQSYSAGFRIEDCSWFLSNHHIVCKKKKKNCHRRILEAPSLLHFMACEWAVLFAMSCHVWVLFFMACLEWTRMFFCFLGFRKFAWCDFCNPVSIPCQIKQRDGYAYIEFVCWKAV